MLIIYLLLLLALGFFEVYAISTIRRGDTISENMWLARFSWIIIPICMLWFWMTGHFFNCTPLSCEPDGILWNDILYIIFGIVVGYSNHKYVRKHIGRET